MKTSPFPIPVHSPSRRRFPESGPGLGILRQFAQGACRTLALSTILLSSVASAILDSNKNGLSDLWEKKHNSGELFPSSFDPQADADGDGWTNAQEAAAGTNPFNANPPAGFLIPNIARLPAIYESPEETGSPYLLSPEGIAITWPTLKGKQYTLLGSDDPIAGNWLQIGEPRIGDGWNLGFEAPLSQPDQGAPNKSFWRVAVQDIDGDGDGLTNSEEHSLGTDPQLATTLSGLPDLWLAQYFAPSLLAGGILAVNPNSDPDADGSSTLEELLASSDPVTADDPSTRQWVAVRGIGPQNFPVLRSGTLTIPAGQSATLIVATASDEYPRFTGAPSQWNDLLEWRVIPSSGSPIETEIRVNDRHDAWEIDEANGTSLPGLPTPVHYEHARTLNAPADEALVVEITVSTTNTEDDQYPSHLAVGLLPVEIVSRDKFLAGSIRIPEGWERMELEFTGTEDLGRYGALLEAGTTKIFESVEDLLSNPGEAQAADQKVWFVKNSADPRKIHFYTCATALGPMEIRLHPNNGGSDEPIRIPHTLTAAPDFAAIIAYVDRWVKGSSFVGEWADSTWLAMGTSEISGEISHQTRACLIPWFDVIDQITGFTPLVMGLCDGVRMGYRDDKAFLARFQGGGVTSAGWVYESAKAEIDRWSEDESARTGQLKAILRDFCGTAVLGYFSGLGPEFTSREGFRAMAWRTWNTVRELGQMQRLIPLASTPLLANAITDWADDFTERSMTGAEKTAWEAEPWDNAPLLDEAESSRNNAWYTFGYTFGYLAEQCATAPVGGETVTLSEICAKNGVSLVGNIAPRAVAVLAIRLHFIKQVLSHPELMENAPRLAYESLMVSAACEPTTTLITEVPASLIEARMDDPAFERTVFNFKEWIGAGIRNENLRGMITDPGGQAILPKRTAQLMCLLGGDADANTLKAFIKAAEDRVVIVEPDGSVNEFFEGFFRAFEGNASLADNLDDPLHSITSLSDGARTRLKYFLSDPDAGVLWKFDDPAFVDGIPQAPRDYFTRGMLAELDAFHRIYEKQGFTHAPDADGYDASGPEWLRIRTCADPDSSGNIAAMKIAVDELVAAAANSPLPLRLHILKKAGTASTLLESSLGNHLAGTPCEDRFVILIEAYDIGPQ